MYKITKQRLGLVCMCLYCHFKFLNLPFFQVTHFTNLSPILQLHLGSGCFYIEYSSSVYKPLKIASWCLFYKYHSTLKTHKHHFLCHFSQCGFDSSEVKIPQMKQHLVQVLTSCICISACVIVPDAKGIKSPVKQSKSLAKPQSRNRLDIPAGHLRDGGGLGSLVFSTSLLFFAFVRQQQNQHSSDVHKNSWTCIKVD